MNSRNATCVVDDVSSGGDIFAVIAVGMLISILGGVQVLFFDLLGCFLLLGPMLYLGELIPCP